MNWQRFLKNFNGLIGGAIGTLLWFVAPFIYRKIDPTAGSYDAGFIMPMIYAFIVLSFSSTFAWVMFKLTAPGLHKVFDKFLENEHSVGYSDSIKWSFALYFFYMAVFVITIVAMV